MIADMPTVPPQSTSSRPPAKGAAATGELRLRAVTVVCALSVIAVCLAVIYGWASDQPAWAQLGAQGSVIVFNTALFYMAVGVALVALTVRWFILMQLLGAAVAVAAAMTALQLPLGENFGIDDWFFQTTSADTAFANMRMSINTAICFVLLGLALTAMRPPGRQGWRFTVTAFLASTVLAIAVVALIGHATGLAAAFGWGGTYGMATPTAVCAFVYAALLMAWAAHYQSRRGLPLSKWFPMIVGNVALVGSLGLWHALSFQDRQRIEQDVHAHFEDLYGDLRYAGRHHEGVLMRMAKRWDAAGGTPEATWREDARNYLEALKGFEALAWVDSTLKVRWIEEIDDGRRGELVSADQELRKAIESARRRGAPLAVIPKSPSSQHLHVWLCYPVLHHGADDGCLVAFFDMRRLMVDVLLRTPMEGQFLTIRDPQHILYGGDPPRDDGVTALAQTAQLPFANLTWTVTDVPSRRWVANRRSALPPLTLGAGVLVATLLTLTLQMAVRARRSLQLASVSEARFRAIVANAPLGISVVDELGRFVQTNAPLQLILGYSEAELRGASFAAVTHPDDLERTWAAYKELITRGISRMQIELRTRGPHGETKWISVCSAALPSVDNARLALSMVSDITERVLSQSRLAIQFQVARILSEDAPPAVAMNQVIQQVCKLLHWELGSVWTLVAPERLALRPLTTWGQSSEEAAEFIRLTEQFTFVTGQGLPGRVWRSGQATWIDDFFKDSNCPRAQIAQECNLHSAVAIPILIQNEFHGVIEFFGREVLQPDAVLLATLALLGAQLGQFFQRKAAEQRLQETLALQQAILDNADRSIITSTPDGVIQIFNHAAERMLGYAAEEMIGQQTPAVIHDPEEVANRAKELSLELGRHIEPGYPVFVAKPNLGEAEEREWTYVRKDCTRFPALLSVTSFRDSAGAITGYLGIANDITDQKRVEEELRQAKHAADDANKAKSAFLANMSHEIRTPMNGIVGMTNLALNTPLRADQKEYLDAIKESADALVTVINDILDFSKVEAGMLDLEEIDFNLQENLDSTMRALSARAQEKGVELRYDVDSNVPAWIAGDPGRLRQIIMNLVGNAIKFTAQGEVALRVSLGERRVADQPNRRLHFAVSDSGIGIAPEKQRLIFEPFSQADSSTTRRFGGTGLGLTICTRLVGLMGGSIWVESEVGRGSTFHFTVQFRLPSNIAGEAVTPPAAAPRRRGLRILVAEDNAINRLVAIRMLELSGHSVVVAVNGQDAVAALANAEFDVVLMDVQMPIVDGFEATALIRAEEMETGRHMPIVAMTAHAMKGDQERCLAAGMDAYVSKPIEDADLFLAIETVMGRKLPVGESDRRSTAPNTPATGEIAPPTGNRFRDDPSAFPVLPPVA